MAAIYYMNSHICPKEFHIYIIWIQIQIFLHLIIDTAVLIKLLHIGAITVIIIASSINRAPQIKDKRGQPLLQCLLIRDLCWHYPEQGGDGSDTRVTAENVVSCKKLFLSEVQRSERSRKSDVEKCTEWRKSERSSEDSWQTKCWSKCGISGAHTCISNFHKQTRSFPRHCKVLQKHPPPFFFFLWWEAWRMQPSRRMRLMFPLVFVMVPFHVTFQPGYYSSSDLRKQSDWQAAHLAPDPEFGDPAAALARDFKNSCFPDNPLIKNTRF